jgi:hypothetical protein
MFGYVIQRILGQKYDIQKCVMIEREREARVRT